LPVQEEVASLWMATNGFLEDVPVEDVRAFEASYLDYMRSAGSAVLDRIVTETWGDEIIADLRTATESFKKGSKWGSVPAKATAAAAR
jgi:F-type H+/Na+-transporting ATPase subunit alpha